MSVSYKKQTHKSKGKAGKTPHPSGMSPHSGARKNKLTKALREREEEVAQRKMDKNKPRPKKKPTPPKVPIIGGDNLIVKKRPTMQEQLKASGVGIDYDHPVYKNKGGGKITYRMSGGQVVASSYD